jgi:threonine dehydrogenase-like Zn-dependent dehydrogenase
LRRSDDGHVQAMKAVTWRGKEDVGVDDVDDPRVQRPTDAVVRVSATALCGSDLHLYANLIPGMKPGDILGHEVVGTVADTGSDVRNVEVGDRVVVPFNVSCGTCFYCAQGLQSQCERTQNARWHRGGSLYGYTHMYGGVPGGQAEYLRVPLADGGPVKIPDVIDDDRAVLLADVLPTAWQGVEYADVPGAATVLVLGLGPIGQMAGRIARHRGAERVIGVDKVPERLRMAERHGIETVDLGTVDDLPDALVDLSGGRGADAVIDCVGLEADGSLLDAILQKTKLQPSRAIALRHAIDAVRRGGTISLLGVYGGWIHAFPIDQLFDKQIQVRMGQANVCRWLDELVPLVADPADPLGTKDFVTHRLQLDEAPAAYQMFQRKDDGAIKVVFRP